MVNNYVFVLNIVFTKTVYFYHSIFFKKTSFLWERISNFLHQKKSVFYSLPLTICFSILTIWLVESLFLGFSKQVLFYFFTKINFGNFFNFLNSYIISRHYLVCLFNIIRLARSFWESVSSLNLCKDNTLLAKIINIKHEISLFYSISRKPTLRIAKIEGIAFICYKGRLLQNTRLALPKQFCFKEAGLNSNSLNTCRKITYIVILRIIQRWRHTNLRLFWPLSPSVTLK